MVQDLKKAIDDRQYTIGVIGLGYVGIPLSLEAVNQGFKTIGFDIDPKKIDKLKAGKTYIKHFSDEVIIGMSNSGLFDATTDFSRIGEADAILICVPTPLNQNREPDLSYIIDTTDAIVPWLRKGQLVVLESTTYPGTTEEIMLPRLESNGLTHGTDFFLAYSPEREDPGNIEFSTGKIPKVVGGHNADATELAAYLYSQLVVKVAQVSSTKTAEAVKLTENIFRSVNIALVNELKVIFHRMGIDVWEVIEGAKSKPFGYMPFYPGPGLGGHCIPIDPFYLSWKAREYDMTTRFIEIAGEINTSMPEYVVSTVMEALNDQAKPLKNSSVLIIGLAYKKDVDDTRESPSFRLMKILKDKGARVDYHDPYIPEILKTRQYAEFAGIRSVPLTPENIASYDVVLISTDHSSIDYDELVANAQIVVDTRNATKNVKDGREKIYKS